MTNKTVNLDSIKKLIESENKNIDSLKRIAIKSLEEQEILVNQILQSSRNEELTFGMRLADKVAKFVGSWSFIIIFGLLVFGWIFLNLMLGLKAFDPYPYILLNLVLSLVAAFQAPIILTPIRDKEKVKG